MGTPSLPGTSGSGAAVKGAPTINGSPATVTLEGDAYAFQPNAADPDGDKLVFSIANAPKWATFDAATGRLSGTPLANDVGLYAGIRIEVSDGATTIALPTFDLVVDPVSHGSVLVSWEAPTENTDDTPLLDLTHFNIYWQSEGSPDKQQVQAPAGSLSYVVENLTPGMYQFMLTAVNSLGVESDLSTPVNVVVR